MRLAIKNPDHWLACQARLRMLILFRSAVWVISASLIGADSYAGTFSVSPTRVELSDAQSRSVIQIDNPTTEPITIQLKMMAWSQPNGKDQLLPSREILATPQIVTIKAGASQLIRVGALRNADPRREIAYRLLLEEIPAPAQPDFKGLQVVLKISLPVFLKPAVEVKEDLQANLSMNSNNELDLQFFNNGNATAHLRDITIHPSDSPDKPIVSYPNSVYVLPGQKRTLTLDPGKFDSSRNYLIKAATSTGTLQLNAIASRR